MSRIRHSATNNQNCIYTPGYVANAARSAARLEAAPSFPGAQLGPASCVRNVWAAIVVAMTWKVE